MNTPSQTAPADLPPPSSTAVSVPEWLQKEYLEMAAGDFTFRIPGVGPDAPTVVNEAGGKQSASPYRFDLIDPKAIFALAAVLDHGAKKYGPENWRNGISRREHINHALIHLFAWLAGDTQDQHLEHAFCRLMMAIGASE